MRSGRRRSAGMLHLSEEEYEARVRQRLLRFHPDGPPAAKPKPDYRPQPLAEAQVLVEVIAALRTHPRVAWAERVNKGFGRLQRRDGSLSPPYAWGYEHALDITGQLRDGRRLEVEVKRPGELPTDDQQATIDGINSARGVAFWVDSIDLVWACLEALAEYPADVSER